MKTALLLCTAALIATSTSKIHAQGMPPEAKAVFDVAANGWKAHDRTHAAVSGESSGPGPSPQHELPAKK